MGSKTLDIGGRPAEYVVVEIISTRQAPDPDKVILTYASGAWITTKVITWEEARRAATDVAFATEFFARLGA